MPTSPQMTPKTKLKRLSKGQFSNENVKRALFKGLVVVEECKTAKKNLGGKNVKKAFTRVLSGKEIKKCRLLNQCKDILPHYASLKGRKWTVSENECDVLGVKVQTPKMILKKRRAIMDFFSSTEASHFAPGKKDFMSQWRASTKTVFK